MSNNDWYGVDDGNDEFCLPEQQKDSTLERSGTHSNWEILRYMQGLYYAGTGSKQEILELEKQLRELVAKGLPYSYIEDYLIRMGYQLKTIKTVFRALTGVDAAVYGNGMKVLDTPGCLPGINSGWGKAKGKDYDYYFIMPWNFAFAVFGQKGDMVRNELEQFNTLREARDFLEKKVATAYYYDPPLEITELKHDIGYSDFGSSNPHGVQTASSLQDALDSGEITPKQFMEQARKAGLVSGDPFVDALIAQSIQIGDTSAGTFEVYVYTHTGEDPDAISKVLKDAGEDITGVSVVYDDRLLVNVVADSKDQAVSKVRDYLATKGVNVSAGLRIEANPDVKDVGEGGNLDIEKLTREELAKLEKELDSTPVGESLAESTPTDFLEEESREEKAAEVPMVVKKILEKLKLWNENLSNFELTITALKYNFLPFDERIERNVPMETQRAVEYFSSSGVVAMVLSVRAKGVAPDLETCKKGLVVFSVVGDEIVVNEVLKGSDKNQYAITDEGLSKYFSSELQESNG